MKPRIIINMHYMALGGAERALLGLLNAFDTNRVNVDLFLNQHTGEFMSLIPNTINLLPELKGYNAIERPMKVVAKEKQWRIVIDRIVGKLRHWMYYHSLSEPYKSFDTSGLSYAVSAVEPHLKPLTCLGEYDLAISFLKPHNIVLNKIKAKKKIAWIHTDYSSVHINTEQELPIWDGYDKIVSISRDCTLSFVKKFPLLQNKIIEIENILSPSFIKVEANANVATEMNDNNGIKLLSIGRYDYAKNYDNVPDILKRVLGQIPNVKWYIIGFGEQENSIKQKIAELGMENNIILLGKKINPYPYIKACDIYVQPSRYEGKSVTVREAQILCKPVVVTNYPTAKSQIIDGIDGVIVPMDNDGCANGIVNYIQNKELQNNIIDYLKSHNYGNESEVNKLYDLL